MSDTPHLRWTVRNEAAAPDGAVRIDIDDYIGAWRGEKNDRDFRAALAAARGRAVHMRIFSGGGDVIEGNAMLNALLEYPGPVTAHVDFAASMATVLAMGADPGGITIAENGWMMLHNPWAIAMGEADDMRRLARVMDGMKAAAIGAYQRHSDMSYAEISAMMDAETWMTAAEAVDAGFAQRIGPRLEVAAALRGAASASAHNSTEAWRIAGLNTPTPQPKDVPMDWLKKMLGLAGVDAAEQPTDEEQAQDMLAARLEELRAANQSLEAEKAARETAEAKADDLAGKVAALRVKVDAAGDMPEVLAELRDTNKALAAQVAALSGGLGDDDEPASPDPGEHEYLALAEKYEADGMSPADAQIKAAEKVPQAYQKFLNSHTV